MRRLFGNTLYILITVAASLLFLPFTLTIALCTVFKEYRDYLATYVHVAMYTDGIHERGVGRMTDQSTQKKEHVATLKELLAEAKSEEEAGNLIPGGFDGKGELSDELENTLKELADMVKVGLTEREQHKITGYIREAMADIEVCRVPDEDTDDEEPFFATGFTLPTEIQHTFIATVTRLEEPEPEFYFE